ncbi:MAG: cache domain-containing protein [Thermodesulfobacteriota bacterium]|nr:cache domain-containing protein [Thermodesulfobacteriota bacterium]
MKKIAKINIRIKLIASLLSVVLITGISSIIIGFIIINKNILSQAYDSVQSDMETAQYIYNEKVYNIHLLTKHLAARSSIRLGIRYNDRKLLLEQLIEANEGLDLDILNITDLKGNVLVRSRNEVFTGDDVSSETFIKYVLKYQKSCFGTDVIEYDLLLREGNDLAEQAFIAVNPTQMARKREKNFEDRGLAIKAASPIFYNNKFVGIIYGAKLLNNNFEFVDNIKDLVFKDEKIDGIEAGSATLFLDDLRISTNVKRQDGTRAIGTQVSEDVYEKVFKQGKMWLDKAFVVNNWFISAYSPIYNIENQPVGILYVGILEAKFDRIKRNTTMYFLVMMFITAVIAVLLSVYLIKHILNPINSLVAASKEIAEGNYSKKIYINTQDEMAYLSSAFNKMVDAIYERDQQLKEHTLKQLAQSEKLASLGRLASGIAHELNNPLTGVLTYSSMLMEDLKESEYKDDLNVIINETMRCRKIITGMLDFARETKLEKHPANINQIINDTLIILEKHVAFHDIMIKEQLSDDIPDINLDINQIKSVINNLALNAADAMPDGGELIISTTYNSETNKIVVQFSDTGTGISEEDLNKIFDPFFTTKETGHGTGLGLSVTYGIIERHNGSIEVKSVIGEGTCFRIEFPVN